MFEALGLAGIAISVAAYVPQIVHLERAHCSEGVSGRAWGMWLAGALLIGALAIQHRDPVFIALQGTTLTSAAVILFLARRYRGMACESHARHGAGHPSARALTSEWSDPPPSEPVHDALAGAA